ncbi:MAG: peptidylprolyl isomerase [Deltaproteobacteria bacterium]|nr:peptidylprolyl isomerase [Deltaproteobacteria bacterium]
MTSCEPDPASVVVAEVNDQIITLAQVEESLAGLQHSNRTDLRLMRRVLNQLIDQTLIVQHGREAGYEISQTELDRAEAELKADYGQEGFVAMLKREGIDYLRWRQDLERRLLIDKIIRSEVTSQVEVRPEDLQQALADRPKEPAVEKIKVRQILAADPQAAEAARRQLENGLSFGEVAARHSLLAGQAGQEIGFFERGEMPPELEQAVWDLKPGQVSSVVKSPHGWHVFILVERRNGPAEEVEAVEKKLRRELQARTLANWLSEMRHRSKIKIYPQRLGRKLSLAGKEEE